MQTNCLQTYNLALITIASKISILKVAVYRLPPVTFSKYMKSRMATEYKQTVITDLRRSMAVTVSIFLSPIFTPQPLRLWGIVITRGGRSGRQAVGRSGERSGSVNISFLPSQACISVLDWQQPLLLCLCVYLPILSVHLSGCLTRSLTERSRGQYTARYEQECVIMCNTALDRYVAAATG